MSRVLWRQTKSASKIEENEKSTSHVVPFATAIRRSGAKRSLNFKEVDLALQIKLRLVVKHV